ncbi:MAG: RNA polymerase sigma factor, partial [Chloroflexota bacterium]
MMTSPKDHPEILPADFQNMFVQFQDQLKSYLFRITTNQLDAEDLAQETYIKAVNNLDGFHGKSSLKTWVFTIATNLARDRLRTQRRWQEDAQDCCRETTRSSPQRVARMRDIVAQSPADLYEFQEHVDFCFTCLAKTLKIEQQLVLILKEIYDFKISEIMTIVQLSEGQVKYTLSQARHIMTDIFDRRCALVNQQGVC